MVNCSFSGKKIPPGQGIMYVQNDGRVYYFLNKKAERNMLNLGRKARTTKWTDEYHRVKKDTLATAAKKETQQ